MREAAMSRSRSASRVAAPAPETDNSRHVRRVAHLNRGRARGLRNARIALDAGDWASAARWEEHAIVCADAIAMLDDHRRDE
jgi:hypothetical protein